MWKSSVLIESGKGQAFTSTEMLHRILNFLNMELVEMRTMHTSDISYCPYDYYLPLFILLLYCHMLLVSNIKSQFKKKLSIANLLLYFWFLTYDCQVGGNQATDMNTFDDCEDKAITESVCTWGHVATSEKKFNKYNHRKGLGFILSVYIT